MENAPSAILSAGFVRRLLTRTSPHTEAPAHRAGRWAGASWEWLVSPRGDWRRRRAGGVASWGPLSAAACSLSSSRSARSARARSSARDSSRAWARASRTLRSSSRPRAASPGARHLGGVRRQRFGQAPGGYLALPLSVVASPGELAGGVLAYAGGLVAGVLGTGLGGLRALLGLLCLILGLAGLRCCMVAGSLGGPDTGLGLDADALGLGGVLLHGLGQPVVGLRRSRRRGRPPLLLLSAHGRHCSLVVVPEHPWLVHRQIRGQASFRALLRDPREQGAYFCLPVPAVPVVLFLAPLGSLPWMSHMVYSDHIAMTSGDPDPARCKHQHLPAS
jgi:hypothetical protein